MDAVGVRAAILRLIEEHGVSIENFLSSNKEKFGYGCTIEEMKDFLFAGKHELTVSILGYAWSASYTKEQYLKLCKDTLKRVEDERDPLSFVGYRSLTLSIRRPRKIRGTSKKLAKPNLTLITMREAHGVKTSRIQRGLGDCDPLTAMSWQLIGFNRTAPSDSNVKIDNNLSDDIERYKSEMKETEYWINAIKAIAPKYLTFPRWNNIIMDDSLIYEELLLQIRSDPPPRIYFYDPRNLKLSNYVPTHSKSLFVMFEGEHKAWYNDPVSFKLFKYPSDGKSGTYVNVEITLVMASLHFDLPININFYVIGGKTLFPGKIARNRNIIHVESTSISKLIY